MDCSNFSKCSAPICLNDADLIKNAVWFPDEEICNQSNELWIKNQHKIKIKAKDSTTCYIHKMLNRSITIRSGITGIDPDKDQDTEELKWLRKHPLRKEMTEERKEELRKRGFQRTA